MELAETYDSRTGGWLYILGSIVIHGILVLGLLLIVYGAFRSETLLFVLPVLLPASAIGLLAFRSELFAINLLILAFGAVLRFSEDIQIEELAFYAFFAIYMTYWFTSRLFFRRDRLCRDALDWLVLGFCGYATFTFVFTIVYGGSLSMGFREWLPLAIFMVYFPVKETCLKYRQQPRYLISALALLAFYVIALNFMEYYGDLSTATEMWRIINERVRANERILLVVALASLVIFLYADTLKSRILSAGGTVLFGAGLIISQSRSIWLSFVLGVFVLFVLLERKKKIYLVALSAASLTVIVAAGAFLLSDFFSLIISALIERFNTIGTATSQDLSLVNRFNEWNAAFDRIIRSPLLGHGFGVNFHFYDLTREVTTVKSHIHNTYIGIWYRHGLVGLVLFLLLFGRGIQLSYLLAKKQLFSRYSRLVGLGGASCLIALALAASTEALFLADEGAFIIALPLAMISGLWQRYTALLPDLTEPTSSS